MTDVDRALSEQGAALADAVEAALPGWAVRVVTALGGPALAEEAERAGQDAARAVVPALRSLLDADVDAQRTNPLAVVRTAVRWPTEVLQAAGVPPVERDEFDATRFPDDVYGLAPMSFADLGPAVQEIGIVWGACKARAHLDRRKGARS